MSIPEIVPAATITQSAEALLASAANTPVLAAELASLHIQRWGQAEDVRQLADFAPHLPELPDPEVHQVYERVLEGEALIVGATSRGEFYYGDGTATYNDQLLVITHPGSALLEAQHATDPVRKASGKREDADHGTGGLGLVLAEDVGGQIIVPLGRQTGNANTDPVHPIKDALFAAAATGRYDSFFSVHGMRPGKVVDLRDPTEIHAVIGLGLDPTEADFDRAERLVRCAGEWGLRVVIGNVTPHLNFAKDPRRNDGSFRDWGDALERSKTGELSAPRVAALMPTSTVTVMRRETGLPSSQLEISRSLRAMPSDIYRRWDVSAEAYGVYLGYQLCRMALETR